MSGREILNELGVNIYRPPLSKIRHRAGWPDLTNPLHLTMLIIDFDTEVSINGMLGFLENSTGAHLGKTAQAFEMIGASQTARVLRKIESCMSEHGVTHERLREPLRKGKEYEITSFAKLHGPSLDDFADEVCAIDDALYLYQKGADASPFPALEKFAEENAAIIHTEVELIRRASGEAN